MFPFVRRSTCILLLIVAGGCQPAARHPAKEDSSRLAARFSIDSLQCSALDAKGQCRIYDVSIVELLARPERFHGKRVLVAGFVHLGFEANGIYLHEDDWKHLLLRNGLWVELASNPPDDVNDHYCNVEGIFNATRRGHLGGWSGTIEHAIINRTWPYPSPGPR